MEEKPNFTEDAVSIAIATNLSVLSFPFSKFSVVPISRKQERWLGADARLLSRSTFLPFYMQFKRPFAHTVPSKAKIIKDRESLKPSLTTAPRTLFFSLQDKKPAHRDFQHNVLFRLRGKLQARGIGDAAYVCPLFLDRQTYFYGLHLAGVKSWIRHWPARPFKKRLVTIRNVLSQLLIEDVPVLAEHVSIPPHVLVSTAKHKYSFTEQGDELCFHSPEALPEGGMLFSQWFEYLVEQAISQERSLYFDDSLGFLRELVQEVIGNEQEDFDLSMFSSSAQAWFAWGDFLREKYGVEQYGIVIGQP